VSLERQPLLADVDLAGELVRLRPVRAGDGRAAYPLIARREAILRWLVWRGPECEEELADGYASWVRSSDVGANYLFALEDGAGALVGTISLRFVDHPFVGDVGYWLAEEVWGRGYATEAGAATRDAAFNQWGYDQVISLIRPLNLPSQRVALRLGMRETRRVQFHGYEHCVFEVARST
jgi:RimJ/RimL family protein N-acetyltransferase